jgi:hypothetical protein
VNMASFKVLCSKSICLEYLTKTMSNLIQDTLHVFEARFELKLFVHKATL